MKSYTLSELMVVCAAREIKNHEKVFAGIGIPMLSAMLAQRTHAPDLVMIFEGGIIDAKPRRLPITVGDPCLVAGASMVSGLHYAFADMLQAGYVDVGFLGTAEIDKLGNLNTTLIGDYNKPKVFLTGSGGANDILSLAKRVVIITEHEKRKFVDKVDFITSPGYLAGPGDREKNGLEWGGPDMVITTLGVLRFDEVTKEMYLHSLHPGVSIEQIKSNTGWELKISPNLTETRPPTKEEINILTEIDPGIFVKHHDLKNSG